MADEATTATAPAAATETATPATPAAEPAQPQRLSHSQRKHSIWESLTKEEPRAERTDAPAEETTATTEEPGKEPPKAAAKPAAVAGKEPAKTDKPEEKADGKAFAALARQKAEVREAEVRVGQERAAVQAEAARAKEAVTAADARAKASEERVERILADPDAFFDHALKKLGITNMQELSRYAQKTWQRPAAQAEPAAKALTQADLDKHLADSRQKEHNERQRVEAETQFEQLFEIPDGDDDVKYPSATLGWTREKRISEGHRIASALTALGRKFNLDQLADAVDELAAQDPDVQKKLRKLGKNPNATPEKTTGTPAGSAKPATQSKPSVATDRATATAPETKPLNGAAKQSHKERLANLQKSIRDGA